MFASAESSHSYYYYRTYRHTDGKWTKGAVALLFVLDAVQTVCTAEGTWRYTVEAWGDQADFVLIRRYRHSANSKSLSRFTHVIYSIILQLGTRCSTLHGCSYHVSGACLLCPQNVVSFESPVQLYVRTFDIKVTTSL